LTMKLKQAYKLFMASEEYKKIYGLERVIDLQCDGIMQFVFDAWCKKNAILVDD